jgi:hypothetical protein
MGSHCLCLALSFLSVLLCEGVLLPALPFPLFQEPLDQSLFEWSVSAVVLTPVCGRSAWPSTAPSPGSCSTLALVFS